MEGNYRERTRLNKKMTEYFDSIYFQHLTYYRDIFEWFECVCVCVKRVSIDRTNISHNSLCVMCARCNAVYKFPNTTHHLLLCLQNCHKFRNNNDNYENMHTLFATQRTQLEMLAISAAVGAIQTE